MTERDPAPEVLDWRGRLYASYLTSGQASLESDDPEVAFSSRAPWIRAVAERHLPADRSVKILDLGSGHGAFLFVLRRMGYGNVTGVDVSREQLEAAARLGIEGVEQADASEYVGKLDTASLDVVLTMDLLEHLSGSDLLRLVDEVHRILRPGGRWLIHVPNAEGLFGPGVRYGDLTHERAFTPSSVRQLCRTAAFNQVEIYPDPPVVHGLVSLCRRLLWSVGVLPVWLLFVAETGCLSPILTRNLMAVAHR